MGEKGKRRDMEARQGPIDPSAYARLREKHYPGIRGYLARKLPDRHDVEDLTQQVFERLSQEPAPENPGAYIDAIARNLLSEHLHRKERELAAIHELCRVCHAHRSEESNGPQDGDRLEAEHEGILKDLTATLGPKSMELLRLRFFEDLSIKEIAARLRCSEQAVHKRLRRTIKFLRRRYHVDE